MSGPSESEGWHDQPPADRPRSIPIVTPFGGEKLAGVILSHRVVGRFCHWRMDLKRTRPCVREQAECEDCRLGYGRRWKGFVYVGTTTSDPVVIWELSDLAIEPFSQRFQGKGLGIYACRATLRRKNGAVQGRLLLSLEDRPVALASVPCLPDLREQLSKIWSAPSRRANVVYRPPDDDNEVIPYPGVG